MSDQPASTGFSPRLLDQVRLAIRTRHYSKSTELAYVQWVRRFILFHDRRHPRNLGEREVADFLTSLATERRLSASTQNQALAALLFLYREVLGRELDWVEGITRARHRTRLPVVLTRAEVGRILAELRSHKRLVVSLLYGSGMRIGECLALRVQDLRFDDLTIFIANGKGGKDRVTLLPAALIPSLQRHLEDVRTLFQADLRLGRGGAWIPPEVAHRTPEAGKEWGWQYLFPRPSLALDRASGQLRRHPADDQSVQRAIRDAATLAGVDKPVTCHSFRHAFAPHLIQDGVDIRTVQSLLGHQDVSTTMIYTHVQIDAARPMHSPLDLLGGAAAPRK